MSYVVGHPATLFAKMSPRVRRFAHRLTGDQKLGEAVYFYAWTKLMEEWDTKGICHPIYIYVLVRREAAKYCTIKNTHVCSDCGRPTKNGRMKVCDAHYYRRRRQSKLGPDAPIQPDHRKPQEVVDAVRRRLALGEKGVDIARDLGLRTAWVSKIKNNRLRPVGPATPKRHKWLTGTQVEIIYAMHDKGYSLKEIAQKLGVVYQTVQKRIERRRLASG